MLKITSTLAGLSVISTFILVVQLSSSAEANKDNDLAHEYALMDSRLTILEKNADSIIDKVTRLDKALEENSDR